MMTAIRGAFGDGTVGDEDQVVIGQLDLLMLAFLDHDDPLSVLLAVLGVDQDVFHLDVVVEVNTVVLEVGQQRFRHGFVLVVLVEFQSGEVRQTIDVVDEPHHVAPHLG